MGDLDDAFDDNPPIRPHREDEMFWGHHAENAYDDGPSSQAWIQQRARAIRYHQERREIDRSGRTDGR